MDGLTFGQLYTIVVLLFLIGLTAVTQHPDWFGPLDGGAVYEVRPFEVIP